MLVVLAILLFMTVPAGCVRTIPAQTDSLATEITPAETTKALVVDRGPSGTLRLWWDSAVPQNPLLASSASARAAYSLVFGQLFRLDANWQPQPELVQDFGYSEARLQLTVSLRQDITFHDSSPVTASDVLTTLNEIQRLGSFSPYAEALSSYSSGRLIDARTLVLQLSRPDPAFLYALTFPILKASEVALPDGSLWQGTRTYQMSNQTAEGLVLNLAATNPAGEPSSGEQRLEQILIKTYASAIQAMRGLEDDELDLAYLPTEALYQYQMRSSLRLDRFASRSYTYFSFGQAISDPLEQVRYKYFLRALRWTKTGLAWPGQVSDIPVPAFHACFDGQPLDLEQVWPDVLAQNGLAVTHPPVAPDPLEQQPDSLLVQTSEELRIILPERQTMLLDMAQQAADWLAEAGQTVVVVPLPEAEFAAQLVSGDYALAFQTDEIPASAEPSWYLARSVPVEQTADEGLPEDGANRYDESLSALETGWPFFKYLGYSQPADEAAADASSRLYRQVLSDLAITVPSGGILLGEAAITYGDRVIGQCQPTLAEPYLGIEELWIWSGS
ncbi:MAG: ABC transporter substrate-binding protein [Eubacteriales bacterium]|nr:ABC transporter substrate-binding protein [Eubacteriales bacterium]